MDYTKFEVVRKEQFPMTEKFAYLDTSTSGMVSRRAKDAMVAYMEDRFEEVEYVKTSFGTFACVALYSGRACVLWARACF